MPRGYRRKRLVHLSVRQYDFDLIGHGLPTSKAARLGRG